MSEVDASTPNMARVYDCWLAGKDNYAADRAEALRLLEIYPPLADLVRENREFITRAVTWAAQEGTGQFIDLGSGLPTRPYLHETARTVTDGPAAVYMDLDKVVITHARALLADPVTRAVMADLRDPAAVLADPVLREVIDPARPVCVILGAVLHFMDAGAARAVTAGYASLMAPGSSLVITVASYDDDALAKELAEAYSAATWHNHPAGDVASFFAGLQMIGPGVTEAQNWQAWLPAPVLCQRAGHVLAGVGRVPSMLDLCARRPHGPATREAHAPENPAVPPTH